MEAMYNPPQTPAMSGPGPIGSGSGWSTPTTGGAYDPQPAQQRGRFGRGFGGGFNQNMMNPNPFGMGYGGMGGFGGMGGMGYGMPQMGYGGYGMPQMGYGGMGGFGGFNPFSMGYGGMGGMGGMGYGMPQMGYGGMRGFGRMERPPMQPDMRLNGPGSPEDPFAAMPMPGPPPRILEGQGPSGGLAGLMGGYQPNTYPQPGRMYPQANFYSSLTDG